MSSTLSLDISTKTGFAVFEGETLVSHGTVFPDKSVKDFGSYPGNYVHYTEYLSDRLFEEVIDPFLQKYKASPSSSQVSVVIEETNASRQNYSQKMLEMLHFCVIKGLSKRGIDPAYVRTGVWRQIVGGNLSKDEKRLNAKISRLKKKCGKRIVKIDGKIVGKRTRKHSALRVCQEIFGLNLKRKDEDAADAICLAYAFLKGAPVCDGSSQGGTLKKVG